MSIEDIDETSIMKAAEDVRLRYVSVSVVVINKE